MADEQATPGSVPEASQSSTPTGDAPLSTPAADVSASTPASPAPSSSSAPTPAVPSPSPSSAPKPPAPAAVAQSSAAPGPAVPDEQKPAANKTDTDKKVKQDEADMPSTIPRAKKGYKQDEVPSDWAKTMAKSAQDWSAVCNDIDLLGKAFDKLYTMHKKSKEVDVELVAGDALNKQADPKPADMSALPNSTPTPQASIEQTANMDTSKVLPAAAAEQPAENSFDKDNVNTTSNTQSGPR